MIGPFSTLTDGFKVDDLFQRNWIYGEMPPSGEELILNLLSQSVARLNSDHGKGKRDEEEVTFLKSVKKEEKADLTERKAVYTTTDMIESLIVYNYLKEESPKLAEELSARHTSTRLQSPDGNISFCG